MHYKIDLILSYSSLIVQFVDIVRVSFGLTHCSLFPVVQSIQLYKYIMEIDS